MRRALVLLLLPALAAAPRARACSMCRCGDPTFNALGADVSTPGRFRVALDGERMEKESASFEGHDSEREQRLTLTGSYSFGENLTFVARVPWLDRHLTTTGDEGSASSSARALGDPELALLVRAWAAPFAAGLGRRAWVTLAAGVKTPWGESDASGDGARLDEHVQPGTGSTDVFTGLSAFALLDERSSLYASAQYRFTGANAHGYRYGNVTLANGAYERKLGSVVDAVIELNFRHAQQDVVDEAGTHDPNTGGDLLAVTPRVILDLGGGLVGRLAVQIPVVQSLYGDQTEKPVVSAGLTFLF